jgi:hypothetical protein
MQVSTPVLMQAQRYPLFSCVTWNKIRNIVICCSSGYILLYQVLFLYALSHLLYACYMSHPPHPAWFDHINNIWWGVQIMTFRILFPCQ